MRLIKKVVASLIIFILIVVLIGLFLPQQVHVYRTLSINASAETIFPYLDESRLFNEWSPWAKIDNKTEYTFTGPASGEGAGMTWQSDHPNVGSGNWVITRSVLNSRVETRLDFGQQGKADAYLQLNSAGDNKVSTEVTWGLKTDLGKNPLSRWFGLMMDKWIGTDYEKGLTNLKELLEK